jgi:hypothetical protein
VQAKSEVVDSASKDTKAKYTAPEAHGAKLRSSNMPAHMRQKAAKVAMNIGKKVPAKKAGKKGSEGGRRESTVGPAGKPNYAVVVGVVVLFTFSFLYLVMKQTKMLD